MRKKSKGDNGRMTLTEFFDEIYSPLRLVGRSRKTDKSYRRSIEMFGETLGKPPTLDDLTDIVVCKHLAKLLARGLRPPTINKERSQLLALWNLGARKKYVDEFPEVRPILEPEVVPCAWTFEELQRLRISCGYMPREYSGVPAGLWWLALHCVLWCCGERIGPILKMNFSAIQGDKIIFPAGDRKGGVKANVCSAPQYCLDALEAIRNPKRDKVFVWPYSENYLYHVYKKILTRAELSTDSRSKFHRMRRSHATHLKALGGDPTQSLGHADAKTTNAYLDVRMIPSKADLLPQFGNGADKASRSIPEPKHIPAAWSALELWRLRISCNYVPPADYGGVPSNRWWLAFQCIIWSTCAPICAVMKLKFSDIQSDRIIFLPDARKGETDAKVCFVPPHVLEAIDMIREPARERVFIWPYLMSYLYNTYSKILRRAELLPQFGNNVAPPK